jgi:hypothetical protein
MPRYSVLPKKSRPPLPVVILEEHIVTTVGQGFVAFTVRPEEVLGSRDIAAISSPFTTIGTTQVI